MRIHLIAVGGSIMHNLAIALKGIGHVVSGSDDEIYDPARSRLEKEGLLPSEGWDAERIDKTIELIILGMHAKVDNPELIRAQELGLKVMSFPEFIGEYARNKQRVVIAGSHGKTTTTSMIMHVLKYAGLEFDYLVGAQLEGFDLMVSLTEAPIMVIEGDEYLSSCLDRRSKFVHYDPDVIVITGIAWDHVNVFPTFENYKDQFRQLIEGVRPESRLYYYEEDDELRRLCKHTKGISQAYAALSGGSDGDRQWISCASGDVEVNVFGKHNRANLGAAFKVCEDLGISEMKFCEVIQSFKGASIRLELISESPLGKAYRDYAHAPSKVKATVEAVKERYPNQAIRVVFELHTYSSLRKDFLDNYVNTLDHADEAVVMFIAKTLEIKRMSPLESKDVIQGFAFENLIVTKDVASLDQHISRWMDGRPAIYLWMSSGHFGDFDIYAASHQLLS